MAWALRAEELGAGEIVVNSIDRDGTGQGYDLDLTGQICASVNLPVVASGGAGTVAHIAEGFEVGASAAIISSMLYSPRARNYPISQIKDELLDMGCAVRPPVSFDGN